MERSPCSICGQNVPTSNLELHESRCQRRQQQVRPSAADQPQRRGGRPVVNIMEYNNSFSSRQQQQQHFTGNRRSRTFYIWIFIIGLFLIMTFVWDIVVRMLASSWQIFLLTIRGHNDFSVVLLEYYIQIYQPSKYAVLWLWQWSLLLEYHVSTMKCLKEFDEHECCSGKRRETFLWLFLGKERGPPEQERDDDEWLTTTLSGSSNNKVRFQTDAWYEATYRLLSDYHFKGIVRGYENVEWLISGYFDYHVPANEVELRTEIGRKIRGNADDFVAIVESLEWKQKDKRVWLDDCYSMERNLCSLVQWNAYTKDLEAQTRKLVGRIQCWDSVGFYVHDRIYNRHRQEPAFRWEYHPEMDFGHEKCHDLNRWNHDYYVEFPVCMAEVVKENNEDQAGTHRTHTLVTGAASHNLQCMVDEYQIYYDDCSSSWNNGNLMVGYNTEFFSGDDNDPTAMEVARLMRDYVYAHTPIDDSVPPVTSSDDVHDIDNDGGSSLPTESGTSTPTQDSSEGNHEHGHHREQQQQQQGHTEEL